MLCSRRTHLRTENNRVDKLYQNQKPHPESTSNERTFTVPAGIKEEARCTCSTLRAIRCRDPAGKACALTIRTTLAIDAVTAGWRVRNYGGKATACSGDAIIARCATRWASLTSGSKEARTTGFARRSCEPSRAGASSRRRAHAVAGAHRGTRG
jgi:hypothetical protein